MNNHIQTPKLKILEQKAAKELVAMKQQQSKNRGNKVTLDNLGDDMNDLKREQSQLR